MGIATPGTPLAYLHPHLEATVFPDVIILPPEQPLWITAPSFRGLLRALAHFGHVQIRPPSSVIDSTRFSVRVNTVLQFTHAPWTKPAWRCTLHVEISPSVLVLGSRERLASHLPTQMTPNSIPVPLPDNAPDLPVTLNAVADFLSRTYSDSKTSGDANLKRLKKVIMETDPEEAASSKRHGFLSRVASRRRADRNEDTFDLVTPFVLPDTSDGA